MLFSVTTVSHFGCVQRPEPKISIRARNGTVSRETGTCVPDLQHYSLLDVAHRQDHSHILSQIQLFLIDEAGGAVTASLLRPDTFP